MKTYSMPVQVLLVSCLFVLLMACSKSPSSDLGNGGGTGGGGNGNPPNPAATFTFEASGNQCLNAVVNGTYKQQTALTSGNTVTIQVNVTKTGTWSVSTPTVNGISFSGAGTFGAVGIQSIQLKGSGTPINAGGFSINVSANGAGCHFSVTVASNSITYIRGISHVFFTFDSNLKPNHLSCSDGESSGGAALTLSQLVAAGDTIIATLVNADKGTTYAWDDYYSSQVIVSFSNINDYGAGGNLGNVDTAGKLQIWIYRKDSQNIAPASNGRPPVKTIIYVPGKFNNNPIVSGKIIMQYPYLNPWYNINAAFMASLFSEPQWKLGQFIRKD